MVQPNGEELARLRRGVATALAMLRNTTHEDELGTATGSGAAAVLADLLTTPSGVIPKQATVPAEEQRTEIAHLIASGFRRGVALRIARILIPRRVVWPGFTAAAASAAVSSAIPLLVELVLAIAVPRYALHTMAAVYWVVALALVTWSAQLVAWWCWVILHGGGQDIEAMLAETGEFQGRLARWLRGTFGLVRQLGLAAAVGAGGAVLLDLARPAIESSLEIGPVSYFSVAWTGFIAGNLGYWVVVVTVLSRRILRRHDLKLIWHSPASTPGLVRLSRGHTVGAAAVLCLAIGVELLAVQVSTYGDSAVLRTVAVGFPIVAAVTCFVFGVLPHVWLYRVVRGARLHTLRLISPRTATVPRTSEEMVETQGWISLYTIVESSPGLPFSTGWLVQYAAAVVSTLVGTLVAVVLQLNP